MNYIKELNAFRDWMLLNDLPTGAIALWHTLMSINNMTGWKEYFNAPNSTVEKLTGLSRQGLVDARKKLLEHKLIEYEKGSKGKAPKYKMCSLVNNIDEKLDQLTHQTTYQTNDQSTYQCGNQSHGVNLTIPKHKLNETKQNKTNIAAADMRANYFDTYTICFGGQPNSIQIQEINSFIDQDGLSVEVICESFRKAAEVGAKYSYARAILNSWAKKGIKSIKDVEREQESYELNRQTKNRKPIRSEKLPEWFIKQKEQQEQLEVAHKDFDFEKDRRRLEERLKKYRERA